MLIFKASEDQVKKIACNAINASSPMGLGFIHYKPKKFKVTDLDGLLTKTGLFLDYVEGRMVKLCIWREGADQWKCLSRTPNSSYQSWCNKYETFEELIRSAGIEDIGKEES